MQERCLVVGHYSVCTICFVLRRGQQQRLFDSNSCISYVGLTSCILSNNVLVVHSDIGCGEIHKSSSSDHTFLVPIFSEVCEVHELTGA